jgi:hypothetical protein
MKLKVDNIAVALAAGWEDGYLGIPGSGTAPGHGLHRWRRILPDGKCDYAAGNYLLPDYLTSLDACATFEAEVLKTKKDADLYEDALCRVCMRDGNTWDPGEVYHFCASAMQRCEALLIFRAGGWNEYEPPAGAQEKTP